MVAAKDVLVAGTVLTGAATLVGKAAMRRGPPAARLVSEEGQPSSDATIGRTATLVVCDGWRRSTAPSPFSEWPPPPSSTSRCSTPTIPTRCAASSRSGSTTTHTGRPQSPLCRECELGGGLALGSRHAAVRRSIREESMSVPTDEPVGDSTDQRNDSLIVPGETCWRSAPADRYAAIVDGADYLRHVKAAMLNAHHRIVIIGWDLDYRTAFERGETTMEGPNHLGPVPALAAVEASRTQRLSAEVEPPSPARFRRVLVRRCAGQSAQPIHLGTNAFRGRRSAPHRRGAPPEDRGRR